MGTNKGRKPNDAIENRLLPGIQHFPELVPLTPSKKLGRRYCYACSHKKEDKKKKKRFIVLLYRM